MSRNLGEVNTLLYDNKYGLNNNKYDFTSTNIGLGFVVTGTVSWLLNLKILKDTPGVLDGFEWLLVIEKSSRAVPRRGILWYVHQCPIKPQPHGPLVRGYMVPPGSGHSLPQAAFTFCHHVTPDLARIDCNATCVPGLFVARKQGSGISPIAHCCH